MYASAAIAAQKLGLLGLDPQADMRRAYAMGFARIWFDYLEQRERLSPTAQGVIHVLRIVDVADQYLAERATPSADTDRISTIMGGLAEDMSRLKVWYVGHTKSRQPEAVAFRFFRTTTHFSVIPKTLNNLPTSSLA